MRVFAWILLLLAAVGAPSAQDSAPAADTTLAERDSAGVAPADSLGGDAVPADSTAATIDALAVQLDSLYAARDAAADAERTWTGRWLWPILWFLGGLAALAGLAFGIRWVADQRLVQSDDALQRSTDATEAVQRQLAEIQAEVRRHGAEAERLQAEVARQLDRSRSLMARDARASRFAAVFNEDPDSAPRPDDSSPTS